MGEFFYTLWVKGGDLVYDGDEALFIVFDDDLFPIEESEDDDV